MAAKYTLKRRIRTGISISAFIFNILFGIPIGFSALLAFNLRIAYATFSSVISVKFITSAGYIVFFISLRSASVKRGKNLLINISVFSSNNIATPAVRSRISNGNYKRFFGV